MKLQFMRDSLKTPAVSGHKTRPRKYSVEMLTPFFDDLDKMSKSQAGRKHNIPNGSIQKLINMYGSDKK